ncbi:MAG TPA: isoprenylcysteine carboxylmethyltransferase family protein [Vicinamibacterales bacterium]
MPAPLIFVNLAWMAWWLSWLAAAWWRDRAARTPPLGQQIPYRLLAAAGALLLFGLYRHTFQSEIVLWRTPDPIGWALVAPAVAGFGFTWWARIHLGRLWSSNVGRKADHRIVDTGPYALVRHPIYSGITLASIATAALRGTAAGWAGAVIMTLGWIVKARLEEGFLREELGAEAYDAYAGRVPMLIPFLR